LESVKVKLASRREAGHADLRLASPASWAIGVNT
jgi:hypothetical protein